jgi:hypothetical protein
MRRTEQLLAARQSACGLQAVYIRGLSIDVLLCIRRKQEDRAGSNTFCGGHRECLSLVFGSFGSELSACSHYRSIRNCMYFYLLKRCGCGYENKYQTTRALISKPATITHSTQSSPFPPSPSITPLPPFPYTQPQFLNWKFGRSLEEEDLKLGYCMHFMRDTDITNLEWRYEGTCVMSEVVRGRATGCWSRVG